MFIKYISEICICIWEKKNPYKVNLKKNLRIKINNTNIFFLFLLDLDVWNYKITSLNKIFGCHFSHKNKISVTPGL